MSISYLILPGVISYLTSFILLKIFVRKKRWLGIFLDRPNARSSHSKFTLRLGGVGILLGVLLPILVGGPLDLDAGQIKYFILMFGFLCMALLGLLSDRFQISVRARLISQSVISAVVVLALGGFRNLEIAGLHFHFEGLGFFLGVLWLVAVTNFYNFMDGINGLATVQGMISGIGIAILGALTHRPAVFNFGLALSSSALGFLPFNVTPAKMFLGDGGSYAIGFYIATFALMDPRFFIPIALFLGVFLFDTLVTLIRRILRGERFEEAHRSHFYQRAVSLGYSHTQVTCLLSLVSLLFTLMGCIYFMVPTLGQMGIFIAALLAMITLASWLVRKEKKLENQLS